MKQGDQVAKRLNGKPLKIEVYADSHFLEEIECLKLKNNSSHLSLERFQKFVKEKSKINSNLYEKFFN